MNPGKMDRRITVQVRTLTRDAAGGRVESWADTFDCWAEVVSQKPKEGIVADADRSIDDRQFRIRYKAGLTSGTHRVLYQLKFYDILGIEEQGRQDRLLLTCRATQALSHV
jgi:SPP1 family predicted phage head-tail adaptor